MRGCCRIPQRYHLRQRILGWALVLTLGFARPTTTEAKIPRALRKLVPAMQGIHPQWVAQCNGMDLSEQAAQNRSVAVRARE